MIRRPRVACAAACLAFFAVAAAAVPADAPLVRPSGFSIPANLLRLSVVFARAPQGATLPRLALVRADGAPIAEPFLTQDLWSPDGRTLTVLMHPGRVKSGLAANERLGRALEPGEAVALTLDGRPLRTWSVGPPDVAPPMPNRWRVSTPQRGTHDPIDVELDGPIDALDAGLIAVRGPDGTRVAGSAQLAIGEARWRFVPNKPWGAGTHVVVAAPDLEDPSGNRPGQDFEHRADAPQDMTDGPSFVPARDRSKE